MKKNATTTTKNAADLASVFAGLTPEQVKALADYAAALMADEAKPEAKQTKKAKTPSGIIGNWCTFKYDGTPRMGKAYKVGNAAHFNVSGEKVKAADCESIKKHATQGEALKAYNAMRKAAAAPKPEAPKPEANADRDERADRINKRNAAIIATIPLIDGNNPEERRDAVRAKLNAAHKAGYPYARLQRNKEHQIDGLHLYCGEKGHGRDADFIALESKKAKSYRDRAAKAKAEGKPAPNRPAGLFIWSPVGGGNLYARGIFGAIAD